MCFIYIVSFTFDGEKFEYKKNIFLLRQVVVTKRKSIVHALYTLYIVVTVHLELGSHNFFCKNKE